MIIKQFFAIVLGSFVTFSVWAKVSDTYRYAVYFKDKANSPYSIENPSEYLSLRAIERREQAGIRIDESDLPVNPAYVKLVVALGVKYIGKSNWSNYIVVGTDDKNVASKIEGLPMVRRVAEIYNNKKAKTDVLSYIMDKLEPKENKSLAGDNIEALPFWDYGQSFTQVNMLGIDYMHSKGYTGKGKIIAVLDGGFFKVDELGPFASIRSNGQILGTWDFVENEPGVYEDNTHGMSVLSCIAGVQQGKLIGTGPGAQFFLLRSEDAATETISEEYYWEMAAVWADSAGADIINSSLGYTTFDNPADSHSYADMDGKTTIVTKAANKAASKGILVVNSAGNSGASSWKYIGAPADGDSVLAIGAVDKDKKIASFSSRGPSFDGRTKPNVCAVGAGTFVSNSAGLIVPSNGTSFSGPLIAGAAATLWQANPTKTNMEIYDAIQRSAHLYKTPNNDYGYGIPHFGFADMLLKNKNPEDYYNAQTLLIFPNPVGQNEFYVDFFTRFTGSIGIEVSDMNGKVILSDTRAVQEQTLTLVSVKLPVDTGAGVYHVRITEGKKTFTGKFVKE